MVKSICQTIRGKNKEIRKNNLKNEYLDINKITFDKNIKNLLDQFI